jgi:hypothetical protein
MWPRLPNLQFEITMMNSPLKSAPRKRPRFQFSLLGLMVLMFAAGAAAAPGYYLMRGGTALPEARLVGMLMMLAGPLLITTILSVFMSMMGRGR